VSAKKNYVRHCVYFLLFGCGYLVTKADLDNVTTHEEFGGDFHFLALKSFFGGVV